MPINKNKNLVCKNVNPVRTILEKKRIQLNVTLHVIKIKTHKCMYESSIHYTILRLTDSA